MAGYPLARTYRSAARLNLQHFLWKQDFQFLVHPSIALPSLENPSIADIGTGTGIWLLDLATSLSGSTQLHGFDVDLSQLPPREWLPPNVKMRHLDVFEELPEDLLGKYDLLHVRFFICVVRNGDPTPLLKMLLRMLKPDGWIQWTEQDLTTVRLHTTCPDISLPHTKALMDFAISPSPHFPASSQYWVKDLANYFKILGLTSVTEVRKPKNPESLSNLHDITLLAMEEMSLRLPEGAEIRNMINGASREFEKNKRGVAITADSVTVVGQKRG